MKQSHQLLTTVMTALFLLMTAGAGATTVSRERAAAIAADVLGTQVTNSTTRLAAPGSGRDNPPYYIFTSPAGGFAVIAADDSRTSSPLLAYSTSGTTHPSSIPPAMTELLEAYAELIEAPGASAPAREEAYTPVLLTTPKFDQGSPYNRKFGPKILTGCVGTAMATVMKYHNWPPVGRGSQTCPGVTPEGYTTHTCDFTTFTPDWDNILLSYTDGYTDPQADAVAELCYATAVSVKTTMSTVGSGARCSNIPDALFRNFFYSPRVVALERNNFQTTEWESRLRDELDAKRPVIYSGFTREAYEYDQYVSSVTGHAFVIDGYDSKSLFHINWGWSGNYDGYFALTALSPTPEFDFSLRATAIMGIEPDLTMAEIPRAAMFLSEYHPQHIDGLISNQENVKANIMGRLTNFCWKVLGEPFKTLSFTVALCNSAGEIRDVSQIKTDLGDYSLSYQDEGFQGEPFYLFGVDAEPGDYLCVVYKGDDMTEWLPMAEIGPMSNRCPAYGYKVPTVPVKWINADGFTIEGNKESNSDPTFMIAGQRWQVCILPPPDVHEFDVLIKDLSDDRTLFYKERSSDRALWLSTYGYQRIGESFEIEIISVKKDEVYPTPVTISDAEPGTLADRVAAAGIPEGITTLTVSGTITDTDFYFMRDRMLSLTTLDISDVSISAHAHNPEGFLPYRCFNEKSSLRSLSLPADLKGMHNSSCKRTGLSEIFIPTTATEIGLNCFNSCEQLSRVTIAQLTPPSISWCVFANSGRPTATLVVPKGCRDAYADHTEWGQFGTIIEDENLHVSGLPSITTPAGVTVEDGCVIAPQGCTVVTPSGLTIGSGTRVRLPGRGLYIITTTAGALKIIH